MSPVLFGTGKSARKSWFYFTENELTPGAARVGNYKAVFNLRGDNGAADRRPRGGHQPRLEGRGEVRRHRAAGLRPLAGPAGALRHLHEQLHRADLDAGDHQRGDQGADEDLRQVPAAQAAERRATRARSRSRTTSGSSGSASSSRRKASTSRCLAATESRPVGPRAGAAGARCRIRPGPVRHARLRERHGDERESGPEWRGGTGRPIGGNDPETEESMRRILGTLGVLVAVLAWTAGPAAAQAKPNIVVIMGDDIGIWNIGAYHRGMMAGRTPNLDKLAAEGMLFTDYYAEASCTAGRANFITGELPIRTGMTTVGQAGVADRPAGGGADDRDGAEVAWATPPASSARTTSATATSSCPRSTASTSSSATSTTSMRWRTPAHPELPAGPPADRSARATWSTRWATDADDADRGCRAGARSASRRSRTPATLYPKRMETVDDEIRDLALKFIDKAKADGKPFFLWLNPTRMHIVTHLSRRSTRRCATPKNGWSIHEAGMAQLDDDRRRRDEEAQGHGRGRQHHRRLHHRQRHRGLHLARRRTDAVRAVQGHGHGRRLPRAGDDPLAGQGAGRQGRERHHLRARLVPDLRRRRRQPEHRRRAEEGQEARRHDLQGASRRLRPDGP